MEEGEDFPGHELLRNVNRTVAKSRKRCNYGDGRVGEVEFGLLSFLVLRYGTFIRRKSQYLVQEWQNVSVSDVWPYIRTVAAPYYTRNQILF